MENKKYVRGKGNLTPAQRKSVAAWIREYEKTKSSNPVMLSRDLNIPVYMIYQLHKGAVSLEWLDTLAQKAGVAVSTILNHAPNGVHLKRRKGRLAAKAPAAVVRQAALPNGRLQFEIEIPHGDTVYCRSGEISITAQGPAGKIVAFEIRDK